MHLGVHVASGERAAVKVLREPGPTAEASMRTEIRALTQLDHPGVVRILDHQFDPPWYAMEYIAGRTLRHWANSALGLPLAGAAAGSTWIGTLTAKKLGEDTPPMAVERIAIDPADLPKAVAVIRSLCSPLAYLHGQGLVHRDLKPDNLLVRANGEVVLVDFGLLARHSAALGHEGLDVSGLGAGTVAYMAPEQIRGELVDARCDLYALGCIFYELLTGAPPFAGDGGTATARGHLDRIPDAPADIVPGCPAVLDELVMRLLAKNPKDRVGYIADVERVLARYAGEPPTAAASVYYLYRPGISRREDHLALVDAKLAEAEEGRGQILLVGGESGVGKTRFVAEVARRAQVRGFRVITGHGEPASGTGGSAGALLHPLRGMGRAMLDRCREQPGILSGSILKIVSQLDPRFGDLPEARGVPEPPTLPPEAARYRMFVASSQIMRVLADSGPLVIILDDLQWADPLTLAFIGFLGGEQLSGTRVLLIGTRRVGDTSKALEEMVVASEADRITLGLLDEASVSEMVQDMLALDEPAPELAKYLTDHTGGNAFFVGEYLRAAIAGGLLWRDGDRGWRLQPADTDGPVDYDALDLPDSMQALVVARIDRLPFNARSIVHAAAVLGREVPLDLLGPTSGLSEGVFLGGLANLLREHVLTESTAASLRFAHESVREVAYASLEAGRRRELHRVAALLLESDDATWKSRLGELGHHWEHAGEAGRAHGIYLAGARVAVSRNSAEEAEELFRRCLKLTSSASARVGPLLELGSDVLWAHGRMQEAADVLREGIAAAREASSRSAEALGLVWLGRTVHVQGDLDAAYDMLWQAVEIARDLGEVSTEGLATARLGSLHHARGEMTEALVLYAEAARLHRLAGDRRSLGETLGNRALLIQEQRGDFDAAMPLYIEAIAIHREVGNRRAEGHVLGNLALAHHRTGDNDRAGRLWDEARRILQEVGDLTFEGIVVSNQAVLAVDEGRYDDASTLFSEALGIHEQVGNKHVVAMVRCEQARFYYEAMDQFDEAEVILNDAEAFFAEVGDHLNVGLVQVHRAGLGIARGESPGPHLDVAWAVVDSIGGGPSSRLAVALKRVEERVGKRA